MRLSNVLPALCLLLCLPGCARYYNWVKNHFTQVELRPECDKAIAPYLKSVNVYDEFATAGMFDALWLSKDVRDYYLARMREHYGLSDTAFEELQAQEYKENNTSLVWYVLITESEDSKIPTLSTADTQRGRLGMWGAQLCIGDAIYNASSIVRIDLPPEFKKIFGSRHTKYRDSFKIVFDRFVDGKDIMPAQGEMKLILRSVKYSVKLCFEVQN